MKTVGGILVRDLKALGRNPIALIVVIALLILPGLYAWYCIIANWDPYSNTERMPIAVVNEDKGASSDMTGDVNIGKNVVEKLHDNDNIDWRFYDSRDEALEDTRMAVCYATIVFPEDLSESIAGIFEGSDKTPTLYYYPNEKRNVVATKVTDSAAQSLIVQINQEFSATVNEKILEKVQEGVNNAQTETSEIRNTALNDINDARSDLKTTITMLDDASVSIAGWRDSVASIQGSLSDTAVQLPEIRTSLDQTSNDLDLLRTRTAEFDSTFSQTLAQANLVLANLSLRTSTRMGEASADVSKATASLNEISEQVKAIIELYGGIESINQFLIDALNDLENAQSQLNTSVERVNGTVQDMNSSIQQMADTANTASNSFSQDALPQLSNGTYQLGKAVSGLSSAIAQFEPQISELQGVLSMTDAALVEADGAISQAKGLLSNVDNDLGSTVADLGALGNAIKTGRIAELLKTEPDNVGSYVSMPAKMVTEKIYPVSNYGTAVAPFYTCLALWVGCFILLSVIKLEIDSTGFENATTTQRYFGRLVFLLLLALIQSQVICGVDILLGIDCANPVAFMFGGALCSLVFMNLLYALVITFRNIGKTLCIVLLIMQIPGSSGMYPIEMMPSFFRAIHPILPFTYSIDALREALCGMHAADYFIDLLVLLGVIAVAFIIGLVIRPRSLNLTQLFDEELQAAGFFMSETQGKGRENARVIRAFRTLAKHDSYRDAIEEHAWAFRKRYPSVRKAGSAALMAMPFILLFIMLPFNIFLDVSTDTKLTALAMLLIILLALQMGLILLEYANHAIEEETRLLGLDLLDSLNDDAAAGYSTFADKADSVRLAIENKVIKVNEEVSNDLLNLSPPLSKDIMGIIPAPTDIGATGWKGAHAPSEASGIKPDDGAHASPKLRYGAARAIFFTDMRLGVKSAIGVVVIMLLVITPSLYAWFNIAGSWDPYSNTGNLKVAVANMDEGYKGDVLPTRVNIGDSIVAQMRDSSGFDWEFVTDQEAIEGVYDESYYAAIVIPKDFSRSMLTYLFDESEYPNMFYYTNEKENPIAPIITQKGADSIQEGIRASFTERIDEVGLSLSADLADYVTNPDFTGYVEKMSGHLDNAIRDMHDGAGTMRTLSSLSGTTSNVVSTASVAMEGLKASSDTAKSALQTAEAGVNDASQAFATSAAIVEDALSGSSGNLDTIAADVDSSLVDLENNLVDVPSVLHGVADVLTNAATTMTTVAQDLREAAELIEDPVEKEEALANVARFEGIATSLTNLSDAVTSAANRSDSLSGNIETTRTEVQELVADAEASLNEANSYYNDSVKVVADDIQSALYSSSDAVHIIMDSLEEAVGGFSGNADSLTSQLNMLSSELTETSGQLDNAASNVASAKKRLSDAFASGDLKQIESVVLGADTSAMAARMAAPLEEKREALYPVSNFGSSMAPFYTVLSLWVGALVLVATLQVHVVNERMEKLRRRYAKVRAFDEYAGRFGIFSVIALLQSLLVLLGDLCLLHIQCANPVAFIVFGAFIGQVFCLFVYTLSELFGDVGKALCVILLIMQVAASGGTFPVEMLDPMLSGLVPYLPFYHGMNLLKECVAGIYWPSVTGNIMFLLAMVGAVLLVGIVARKPLRRFDDWFEGQLEKTGYM